MRLRIVCALLALGMLPGLALGRTVVDSAGRQVEVPDHIRRVFAAGPPAAVLVYALAPQMLLGWPRALTVEQESFLAPPYRHLPETGRLTGRGGTANLETVLRLKPDVIVDFGSLRPTYVSLANRVQRQTGIPYLLIDGRFANTAAALRLLGSVLGVQARAERLAAYAERTFAELDAGLAKVPLQQRPRVYLARAADGLETGLMGSINTEIIERVGGRNVATAGPRARRHGLARMSMEQVLLANPDTIITWERPFYETVRHNPLWAQVAAVKRGRVYLSPNAPFGWIDRPPSLNRLIGLRWLAALFYPRQFTYDLPTQVREFYRLFYQVQLSDAQVERLIAWSSGRPAG